MTTPADRYGTDLALSASGDLVVWANGALGTVTDSENCIQALRGRMLTGRGELPLWPDYGSGFWQRVGDKLDEQLLVAQANVELRAIIESDRRFLAATGTQALAVVPDSGAPTTVQIKTRLALAGGDELVVSDLAQVVDVATIDQQSDLENFADLADLETAGDFFFTNDDVELDDLQDAAAIEDLIDNFDDPEGL